MSNLADEPVESRLRIRRRRSVAFAAVLPLPENRIALGDALELHGRQSAISSAFIDLAQRQDVASAVTTAGGVATNAVLQARHTVSVHFLRTPVPKLARIRQRRNPHAVRSEEHTSELQSIMRT